MDMDFWYDLLTSPVILITALMIGSFGEMVKRSVNSKGIEKDVVSYRDSAAPKPEDKPPLWKRIYYYTLPSQPVLVGLSLGLVPWLPAADALSKPGYEFASHLGTYGLAGVLCKVGYDTIISTAKRMVRKKGQEITGRSTPPPAPPAGGENG